MSAFNTCFEAVPPGLSPYANAGGGCPVHCATEMELVIPAVCATAIEYTFGAEEAQVRLPPVWRCGCGFQLDATGWPESSAEPLAPEVRVPVLTGTATA